MTSWASSSAAAIIAIALLPLAAPLASAEDYKVGDEVIIVGPAELVLDPDKEATGDNLVRRMMTTHEVDIVAVKSPWLQVEWLREKAWVHHEHVHRDWQSVERWYAAKLEANPNDPLALAGRAETWIEKSQWDKAEQDVNEAIRLDPEDKQGVLLYGLSGYLWSQRGDWQKSLEFTVKELQRHPQDELLHFQRARALAELRRWSEAREALHADVLQGRYRFQSKISEALIPIGQKNYAKALEILTTLRQERPDCAALLYWMAACYRFNNQLELALTTINQAIEIKPRETTYLKERASIYVESGREYAALSAITEAIELEPDNVNLLAGRVFILTKMKNYGRALKELEEIEQQFPGLPLTVREQIRIYAKAEDYPKLLEAGKRLIELTPEDIDGYKSCAAACVKLNRLDEAAHYLRETVRRDPDDFAIREKFAALLYMTENYPEAAEQASQALAANPEDTATRFIRANSLIHEERFEESQEDFATLIAQEPDKFLWYIHRTELWIAMKDKEKAILDADKAVELQPSNEILRKRASIYRAFEDWPAALHEYSEILKKSPSDVQCWVDRADLYEEMGEIDNAIDDLTKAITLNPTVRASYLARARLWNKKGEKEKAQQDTKRFLSGP